MKKILVAAVIALVFIGCTKDKFKTEPQVEIKSLQPGEVFNDGYFSLRAIVRDKEGDLQDTITLYEKYYDIGSPTPLIEDSIKYALSSFGFPVSSEIEVQINYSYNEQRDGYINIPLQNIDREMAVGIVVKDKAGNRSEYKESNRIILKQL